MPNRPVEPPTTTPHEPPTQTPRPSGPDIDFGTPHPGPSEVGAPGTVRPRQGEGADQLPRGVQSRIINESGGAPITDMPKF